MKPSEALELLTLAAAFDRRTIGRSDAAAWADALFGLDPADCAEAVRAHFRDSTDYLMPAHVRRGVKAIRADRIRTASSALLEPPDVDYQDIPGYLAGIRERRNAIAAGRPVTPEPETKPRDVQALLEDRERAMPKMPPALPQENSKRRSA